jgi:hypothetical protein
MKFSDLNEALPEAYAMWQDMNPHAPGRKMGHMRIGDEEIGTPTEGVPVTVDHYFL